MRRSQQRAHAGARFFWLVIATGFLICKSVEAAQLPASLSDSEFWRIVTEFSEPGGTFQPQLMTNEDSLQFVIPALKQTLPRGRTYVGVGTEQNFTYIAATEPRMAFVLDIRRDNMLEQLMYKALFELSSDRADFLSRLFSRKPVSKLNSDSSAGALFEAYRSAEADPALREENLRAVLENLAAKHKMPLSDSDKARITSFMNAFSSAGPYGLKGSGDKNLSYAQSMTGIDLAGQNQSYLATEANFRTVQSLEKQNLVVPLVGDFGGTKTIVAIGQYLRDHDATVGAFYVSNVERYLWDQGQPARQFYSNAAALPRDASSLFIRSVTVDISRRLNISVPGGKENWRSFLSPMSDFLKAFAEGRIQNYKQVFDLKL
jgi:hypothetical protein